MDFPQRRILLQFSDPLDRNSDPDSVKGNSGIANGNLDILPKDGIPSCVIFPTIHIKMRSFWLDIEK